MAERADNTGVGARQIICAFLDRPELRDESVRVLRRLVGRKKFEQTFAGVYARGIREGMAEARKEVSAEIREARAELREARARGREKALYPLIEGIDRALRQRSIKLTKQQIAALGRKSPKQLVLACVYATSATSRSDFVRKARLNGRTGRANARGNGRKSGKG